MEREHLTTRLNSAIASLCQEGEQTRPAVLNFLAGRNTLVKRLKEGWDKRVLAEGQLVCEGYDADDARKKVVKTMVIPALTIAGIYLERGCLELGELYPPISSRREFSLVYSAVALTTGHTFLIRSCYESMVGADSTQEHVTTGTNYLDLSREIHPNYFENNKRMDISFILRCCGDNLRLE